MEIISCEAKRSTKGSFANYFIGIREYGSLCRTDTFTLLSDAA